jgi:nicotinate-nucleotide adenylyltransferase
VTPGADATDAALTGAREIGVMGGTFDPIHLGHLAVAEEARESLGLDRILFVPAGRPPHKPAGTVTDAEDRVAMVALAISDNPAFELSRIEVDRPGLSWTVDTVAALAVELGADVPADRGSRRLTVILSAETFADLPTWRDPRRLLELARVAVTPRIDFAVPSRAAMAARFPGLEDRVVFLEGPRLGVSSTAIRARVATGRSIRYLVPPAVAAYIADHGLYRTESPAPGPEPIESTTSWRTMPT